METDTFDQETELYLNSLEDRLDELIRVCERMAEENRCLREQESALLAERKELIEQNKQFRARIEAMVARLRGLERSS